MLSKLSAPISVALPSGARPPLSVCVCMYVCTCVCTLQGCSAFTYIHSKQCTPKYMYMYINIYIYTYIYKHTYIYLYICIYLYIYMYIYTHTYICAYIHMFISILTFVRIHIHVRVYKIYINIHKFHLPDTILPLCCFFIDKNTVERGLSHIYIFFFLIYLCVCLNVYICTHIYVER